MARIKGVLYSDELFNTPKKNAVMLGEKPQVGEFYEQAKQFNITTKPFDIEAFISYCGITIIYEDLGNYSGYILPGETGWMISAHQYDSKERQRFTLAHELIHFFYHKNEIESKKEKYNERITFRNDANNNAIENEANLIAGELLMPTDDFITEYSKSQNLDKVGNIFGVSSAAAWVRAKQLNLI